MALNLLSAGLAHGLLPIGLIEPGYQFDAVAVSTDVPGTNLAIWPEYDSPDDVMQKIIHNVSRADIARVWVDGRVVVG